MSGFRLTPRAVKSLTSIFEWTIDHFGESQAESYRDAVVERCKALAEGRPPHGRPCDLLLTGCADARGLLYYREGGHFILNQCKDTGIVVVEFAHERRDLPKLIERIKRLEA